MLGGLVHWHPTDPLSSQSVWSGWVVVKKMYPRVLHDSRRLGLDPGRQLGACTRCPIWVTNSGPTQTALCLARHHHTRNYLGINLGPPKIPR